VEVTRPRASSLLIDPGSDSLTQKLASTLCDKLGQLPPSAANLVTLVGDQPHHALEAVEAAIQLLRRHAAQQDESYFVRHGLDGVRHFHRQHMRLSGILLYSLQRNTPPTIALWLNAQAKHTLPPALQNLLRGLV
jgi:hypothetical protein